MTEPNAARRRRWKIAGWRIGVVVVVAVIVIVATWLYAALFDDPEPTVNPDRKVALEDQLRPKESAEEALTRYEEILRETADAIGELVPGLTWRWNRDADFLDCTGEFAETRGVRVGTRSRLADGPIPDDVWPAALQVVRDRAGKLGADQEHVYANKPGHHDIAVYGDNGVEIRLLSRERAVLTATSDCHLKQADLPPEAE
ncbi:LppA family lipoprotein [Mycolicibacterium celeriflavum]|uniref:LppA family lipoprotein n=1 Tax=Mycolicibacterium celeriflavum TaxID=1249101 RepID=UPI003CEF447D